MATIKAVLLYVAVFLAVASAHEMPMVYSADFIPEAPILPNEFTSAISEHTFPSSGEGMYVEGYYYYSNNLQALQLDYTVPGSFVTELLKDSVLTVATFTGGVVFCSNVSDPLPFLPPTILEGFDFLGVALSPEGEMLYSWGGEFYGAPLIIFTDARSGALVFEFGEHFSIQFLSFDEGVPSSVFREGCGTANSKAHPIADHRLHPLLTMH